MFHLSKLIYVTVSLIVGVEKSQGRVHHLDVEDDLRQSIVLTTFGLLRGGFIFVNITNFNTSYPNVTSMPSDNLGLTLDRAKNAGLSKFVSASNGDCALDHDQEANGQDGVGLLLFNFDFKNLRLQVRRQPGSLHDIWVTHLEEKDFKRVALYRMQEKFGINIGTDYFMDFASVETVSSSANKNGIGGTTNKRENVTSVPSEKTLATIQGTQRTDERRRKREISNSSTVPSTTTVASPVATNADDFSTLPGEIVTDSIPLVFNSTSGTYSVYFAVLVTRWEEEGLYKLMFHNCQPKSPRSVNFTVSLVERNVNTFLSAGDRLQPTVYFSFAIVYFALAALWLYVLCRSSTGVFKIHYLMLVVVLVKSLSLVFHGLNYHFIGKEGFQEEAFAILWYITYLVRGILLFVTILLIGVGWAFIKHVLSDREKKIFVVVIPLQILSNISQIIIEETEEGESQYTTWRDILILVDLVCCGAILFPVVWSIRHLQDASQTDGKAAISLAKLKIFRHFYILIVCYIYSTRIVVYLLQITLPFQLSWMEEVFFEIATLAFFILTGYKFRPASNNPYLQLPTDSDDEDEVDEIVTRSGLLETVNKVNVKFSDETSFIEDKVKQRESSHDYD